MQKATAVSQVQVLCRLAALEAAHVVAFAFVFAFVFVFAFAFAAAAAAAAAAVVAQCDRGLDRGRQRAVERAVVPHADLLPRAALAPRCYPRAQRAARSLRPAAAHAL